MEENAQKHNELLPQLFRAEYAKMTAVLCRHFGLQHIEIAEDIVSETFLKATEEWAAKGVPQNPEGWLYVVSKNKAKDYLKRVAIFESQVKNEITTNNTEHAETAFDFTPQTITDSQLAMIFAVCNPANAIEAQICLALQILCGFSVEEIAHAFMAKTETIKKRLLRARARLREDNFTIKPLQEEMVKARLDTVLRTLYLLFNEGYFSKSNDVFIRKDLCGEAMRLTLILTENTLTNTPSTNALLALMCFQSSRFDARMNTEGEILLYEQQDKTLWDKALIEKGNYYLVSAFTGTGVSKYHIEAGIAYWHTTPTGQNKWQHILQLYNQLILIEYSPITALSRAFAYAKVYGSAEGIKEVEKLGLKTVGYYHALLGYLYAGVDVQKAVYHYDEAIRLSKSAAEKKTLEKEKQRLIV